MKNLILTYILTQLTFTIPIFAGPTLEELETLSSKLNECSGNNTADFYTFDPKDFNASKIMKKLRSPDRYPLGKSCLKGRKFSKSKRNASKLAIQFINENTSFHDCLVEVLSTAEEKMLIDVVTDPTNLGVFSSMYSTSNDNPEACDTNFFQIYRADGVMLEIMRDNTD